MESVQSVTPPLGSEGERSRINKDDLLISITADLGSVCVANDEVIGGYVSQHVALCRPNESVESSRWLGYFILSDIAKEQFIGSAYGGTKIQLSLEDIRELWIVKPRCEDQIEVALYIDEQLTKFAKIIDFAESQIILLKERRTALISAAVTGKIDVRDWVAPPVSQTHKEVAA
jgi:type I restriction enzyme S subunit